VRAQRGYGAILSFETEGKLIGSFTRDPQIVGPSGLPLDPSGVLVYRNG
jgi:hypothetical protein